MSTFIIKHSSEEIFTNEERKIFYQEFPLSIEGIFGMHAGFVTCDIRTSTDPTTLSLRGINLLKFNSQSHDQYLFDFDLLANELSPPISVRPIAILKQKIDLLVDIVDKLDEKHRNYKDIINKSMTRALIWDLGGGNFFSPEICIFPFGLLICATSPTSLYQFAKDTFYGLSNKNTDGTDPVMIVSSFIPFNELPLIKITQHHIDRCFSVILDEDLSNHQKIEALNFLSNFLNHLYLETPSTQKTDKDPLIFEDGAVFKRFNFQII